MTPLEVSQSESKYSRYHINAPARTLIYRVDYHCPTRNRQPKIIKPLLTVVRSSLGNGYIITGESMTMYDRTVEITKAEANEICQSWGHSFKDIKYKRTIPTPPPP